MTVVVAELEGNASVIPPLVQPDASGKITLTAAEADVFYNYNGFGYWEKPSVYKKQWHFAVPHSGRYRVEAVYTDAGATSRAEFAVDGRSLTAELGAASTEKTVSVGEVELTARPFSTVTVTPPHPFAKGTRLGMDLKGVVLTPAGR